MYSIVSISARNNDNLKLVNVFKMSGIKESGASIMLSVWSLL